MNLDTYVDLIKAGGPGSGCQGPNCGRPLGHSGEHAPNVDEELLRSTKKAGLLFGQPNVEILRIGETWQVHQRLGSGNSKKIAFGFKSKSEAEDWIKKEKGLILYKGITPSGDAPDDYEEVT